MRKKLLSFCTAIVYLAGLTAGLAACNNHEHDYVEEIVNPTCTEQGYTVYRCDCGENYVSDFTDALGHDFGEGWVTVKKDTADEIGFAKRTCVVCNHTEYKEIPCGSSNYTVVFTANDVMGYIDGELSQTLANGETTTEVTAVAKPGYEFLCWSNGEQSATVSITATEDTELTAYFKIKSLELPVMTVVTENSSPVADKINYVNCTVSVMNTEEKYCLTEETAGIRGRGNTTWSLPKKPYKLKFDSKVNLFGNGKAKKWTLLANYCDPSLVRNYLTYSIGGESGLLDNVKYTTSAQNVELYLNGEYCGVYLVCEQIEASSTRVNIDEDMQYENGEIKVNTGYLLETDTAYAPQEGIENQDYFWIDDNGDKRAYSIKSPDTEDEYYLAHKDEFIAFITNKTQTAYTALQLEDTPENYEQIKQVVDVNSFLDGYIIDELTNLSDGEYSSFHIFYDSSDGRFYRGPIWDYDASIGNCAYIPEKSMPDDGLHANHISWYKYLLNFKEFRNALAERLNYLENGNLFNDYIDSKLSELKSLSGSFERNFEKWDILGKYDQTLSHWNTEEIFSINTWQEQLDFVADWLKQSLKYMVSVYCNVNSDL